MHYVGSVPVQNSNRSICTIGRFRNPKFGIFGSSFPTPLKKVWDSAQISLYPKSEKKKIQRTFVWTSPSLLKKTHAGDSESQPFSTLGVPASQFMAPLQCLSGKPRQLQLFLEARAFLTCADSSPVTSENRRTHLMGTRARLAAV